MWYPAAVESQTDRDLVDEWRALIARKTRVWVALERELEDKHGIGASEFEVLDRLAESSCVTKQGLRVQELADLVCLSQSALSRLVAKLESRGLVRRALCDFDRRGIYVELTERGSELHAAARPTHRGVLRETLETCASGKPAKSAVAAARTVTTDPVVASASTAASTPASTAV
jgi:DNA-binding MarR family transcriptional regulator